MVLAYHQKNEIISPLKLQQSRWQLDDILPLDYQLPSGIMENIEANIHANFLMLLSRDVYSEGDSQSLFDYLLSRQGEFTPDFWLMMEKWLADELQHYEALRRVYRLLAGVSFEAMDLAFAKRNHEIEPIRSLLKDEFTILVALLFDEMGSTISYRRDLWEYYQYYSHEIGRIGKYLVMDEGIHFNNAVNLIKKNHSDRIQEIPFLLDQISQLESTLRRYCKTFFLDHAQEQFRFPKNFNQVIIQMILARFGLDKFPNEANTLWSWKPDGCVLVPTVVPNGFSNL
jgi:hypothetical protein